MAGAHLDSVPEGPGINDNGSGLERPARGRRADGQGQGWPTSFGSRGGAPRRPASSVRPSTSTSLTAEQLAEHRDVPELRHGRPRRTTASSSTTATARASALVGPDGSDEIEALFEQYYTDRDIPSEPTAFNGRSDYQAFINNGVPAGGLFTGAEGTKTAEQAAKWGGTAGEAYDSCYHQACDTIDNLSRKALRINSDAIAFVTYLYATGGEVIND